MDHLRERWGKEKKREFFKYLLLIQSLTQKKKTQDPPVESDQAIDPRSNFFLSPLANTMDPWEILLSYFTVVPAMRKIYYKKEWPEIIPNHKHTKKNDF